MTRCGKALATTLLYTFACCNAASAQDAERSWNLGLALGYGERSNPLVSGESIDINSVIDFSWYGERFFFDNGDFGYLLAEQRNYSFNLVATFNNERNFYNYLTGRTFGLDSLVNDGLRVANAPTLGAESQAPLAGSEKNIDSAFVTSIGLPSNTSTDYINENAELADRDFALQSGLEFLYISRWGDIQAQVLSDVSDTHNGQEAWLSWSRPWYTRSNEFTLTLGAEWKSGDLVSYYYGVRPEESFPGREVYQSSSGTNGFIRFAARHAFSQHLHLVGMIEREFLSSAISNSPIVDTAKTDTFFAGLLYQF